MNVTIATTILIIIGIINSAACSKLQFARFIRSRSALFYNTRLTTYSSQLKKSEK